MGSALGWSECMHDLLVLIATCFSACFFSEECALLFIPSDFFTLSELVIIPWHRSVVIVADINRQINFGQ